ncbi:hypothetical protein ACTMTI_51620 [Nonomuraea sp. H19]|uniref:hypothetical protein n=1 Tax=Nonomuraea sp. H19 TaxID=3452206 RepID=UPI003F8B6EAA
MASRFAWRLFPIGLLRSSGLPFAWLDGMAQPDLLHRTDAAAAAADELAVVRTKVIAALKAAQAECDDGERPALNRTLKAVIHFRAVPVVPSVAVAAAEPWQEAIAEFQRAHNLLDESLARTVEAECASLFHNVRDELFLEGVLMSSPHAHHELVRSIRQDRLTSRAETTAYRYLQRFCAKAETTGHVGPLNLVRVADGDADPGAGTFFHHHDPVLGELTYWSAGDGRRAERRTSISYWAAEALANAVLRDRELGLRLHRPRRVLAAAGLEPAQDLTSAQRAVLDAADGRRTLAEIATMIGQPADASATIVNGLADRRLVRLDRHLPDHTADPGADLRERLAEAGTATAAAAGSVLDDVSAFARLPYQRRLRALTDLTARFSELTGQPAWRGEGRISSDRAILFEDALDNVQGLRVSTAGARRLTEQLGTVLDLLASLAVDERAAGQRELARLMRAEGRAHLPAAVVRQWPAPVPPPGTGRVQRLAGLLDPGVPVVRLTRDDLEAAGLLRDDLERWPLFGAADLMLAGGSEPLLVLSELHHIWPNLARPVRGLYSDEQLGVAQLSRLLAEQLAPAQPTLQEIRRTQKGADNSPAGHRLLCLDATSPEPGAIEVDTVHVRRWDSGFIGLHDPRTGRDLWLLPEYDDAGVEVGGLAHCAIPAMELPRLRLGEHTPRVVVDGVVLQRRRWDPLPQEVPGFAGRVPTARDWRRLHAWRRRLALPRHTFYLVDTESKPMFLDFLSVLSVRSFARAVETATALTITEMLPEPSRLWLRTPDGTLASELRTLWWRSRPPYPEGD